jgi:hypothetical protein
MHYRFFGQFEIREGYQAVFWSLFLVEAMSPDLNIWLSDFIHSENFRDERLPFIIKKNFGNPDRFLRGSFNEELLKATDFKVLNKEDLLEYLEDYSKHESWKDDREEFKSLLHKFNGFFINEDPDEIFLINKEWFNKGEKILSSDSEYYIYSFLMIWFDKPRKQINVCEWNYD